ncbi:MAG: Tol-Pal system protein TolB [Sphingomonadaceae bacterium]|nr:Tol-Pal system protein TolB [Sphingomonadaceae bacterium]
MEKNHPRSLCESPLHEVVEGKKLRTPPFSPLQHLLEGLGVVLLLTTSPAAAQIKVDVTDESGNDMTIAVPVMPTPAVAQTEAGTTEALGRQVAHVVAADLKGSGLFKPVGPAGLPGISFAEVTAPNFAYWPGTGAVALVQGFVRANAGGEITVGCYLYDVALKTELTRAGYVLPARDWRRGAHKCADAIYARLSGESPFFDSRVAYIAETGPKDHRVKRLAIMDSDGANHRFLTNGQNIVLTPRFSPDYKSILYLSYANKRPRIYVYNLGTGQQRLVTESANQTLAPRWSPDGRTILYSMSVAGNTDIYSIPAAGGTPRKLTNSPGIDVGGSFSPDGRRIVFESDRSGKQQLYVMDADGSNQQRISFGGGAYATPEWSPRGDLIAYTKLAGNFRIGVMTPGGQGERLLTNSWQDESPTWSPNGRVIQFFRTSQGRGGKSSLWQVDLTGVNERRLPTPVDGSDPTWGPLLP